MFRSHEMGSQYIGVVPDQLSFFDGSVFLAVFVLPTKNNDPFFSIKTPNVVILETAITFSISRVDGIRQPSVQRCKLGCLPITVARNYSNVGGAQL